MEEVKNYKVYKHVNKINGKIYIGITIQKPEKRWRNGNGYKNSILFYRAIQKYGWNNFEHIILFDHLTKDEAEEIEIELIDFHKSNQQEFGYNIENGGNTTGTHSEETRKKIGLKSKGRKCTKETKEKISKALKGKMAGSKNPMYGIRLCGVKNHNFDKKLSKETREKISKNHADVSGKNNPYYGKTGALNHFSKKIILIETNQIFGGIREAGRILNLDSSSISACCKGKRKSTKGYHFMYLEDYNKQKEGNIND